MWAAFGLALLLTGAVFFARNAISVIGTPRWEGRFWEVFFTPSFSIAGSPVGPELGLFLVWCPFVFAALAVPLLVIAAFRQPAVRRRHAEWARGAAGESSAPEAYPGASPAAEDRPSPGR